MHAHRGPGQTRAAAHRVTSDRDAVAVALAAAFLDGPWTSAAELAARGGEVVGITPRRLRNASSQVMAAYRDAPTDRRRELAAYIGQLTVFSRLWKRAPHPQVRRHPLPLSAMGRMRWPVPSIATIADLAAWTGLSISDLDWYADTRSIERMASSRLRHYDRTWVYTRRGGVRLLEQPRHRLKSLQRRVLHEILDLMPAHDAAHGFVGGRSVLTYAAPHCNRRVVLHLDLEAFFGSISAGRVFGVLRLAGYPEAVAHTLTGLLTTVVPHSDLREAPQALRDEDLDARRRLLQQLSHPHLPQGSPTSPRLANLVTYRLDARLTGLARAADASYTRYADDLAFSFDGESAARRARRFLDAARDVVRAEGFRVNGSKTRITAQGQRQALCGVVVNDRLSTIRPDRDELRALLHNCVVRGPASQNHGQHPDFRAHLLGRIAWAGAVNAAQGSRLRAQFDQIRW